MPNSALGALLACALPIVSASAAPAVGASPFDGAHWIWSAATGDPRHPDDDGCRLSLPFTLPSAPTKATAWVSADNHFRLFVDGHEAGHGDDWSHPKMLELASKLSAGAHRLDALCWNDGNAAAFLCALHLTFADGSTQTIVSDATWTAAPIDPATARTGETPATETSSAHARDVGAYGIAPWGKLEVPQLDNRFEPLPGFRVDVVADGVGSVVGIALDPKGRLYVASEGLRITRLTESASGAFEGAETYTDAIANAQGMFRDGDALFVTGDGPQGTGLYRVPEATRAPELLGRFDGEMGEHGPHAIVRGPDGWLYLAIGNHAGVAEKISAASPLSPLRYEGHLLPRYVDPRGHATQCRAPGGVVARVNEKTREWQLFAGGFRNHYDLCFDRGGALFTFDSDMEWDVGLPWYRAVRFVHVVPGGDYGWRTGSSTWPSWYADSLPPVCETGRGSPTGMCCYDGTQFPEHFRGAILAGDWSQGQILAFHSNRSGATFSADVDVLLSGRQRSRRRARREPPLLRRRTRDGGRGLSALVRGAGGLEPSRADGEGGNAGRHRGEDAGVHREDADARAARGARRRRSLCPLPRGARARAARSGGVRERGARARLAAGARRSARRARARRARELRSGRVEAAARRGRAPRRGGE
jgi:glucose/arabinose dehydrogenase